MRYRVIIPTIFFLLFFILCENTYATSSNLDKQDNIILTSNFDINHTSIAQGTSNNYFIFFSNKLDSGKSGIGIASSDNKIDWQIINREIILPNESAHPNWSETDVFSPTVIFYNNEYYMWFVSSRAGSRQFKSGESIYRIHFSKSSDGLSWSNPVNVISPSPNSWNSEATSSPSVLVENDQFKMWYSGRDSKGLWKIGYASSPNGLDWTQLGTNPILQSSESWESAGKHLPGTVSPSVVKYKNKYIILYSTGEQAPFNNIAIAISNDGVSWSKYSFHNPLIQRESGKFDSNMVSSPDALVLDSELWIYYSGHDGNKWSIGLAKGDLDIDPEESKDAIVVVPGMFSSYDPVGLSICSKTPWQNWKLIPQVTEYNGILKTLQTQGYTLNQNLFIFPYDWRQKITDSGQDLKSFIDTQVIPKNPDSKINLVGHSLGGLVSRSYLQEYAPAGLVDQIITLGSPHQGVTEAYKAWAGGELPEDGPMRVAASFIVNICKIKTGSLTNKSAIQKTAPVYKDILPTYQYLKGAATHVWLDMDKLGDEFNNSYLSGLNQTYSNYSDKFTKITSTSFDVDKVYGVAGYMEDQIRGVYMHGRPTTVLISAPGDKTVLAESASVTNENYIDIPLDHKGLIYSREGIQKILEVLGIVVELDDITAGQPTNFKPSLSLLMRSPATINITDQNNQVISSGDKFVFIPNYDSGNYKVEVVGTDKGSYELVVGQITENSTHWESFEETTTQNEIDTYNISINPDQPNQPVIKDNNSIHPIQSASNKITQLQNIENNPILDQINQLLSNLDKLSDQEKVDQALRIIRYLGSYYQETTNTEGKLLALETIQQIETLLSNLDPELDLSSARFKLAESIQQKKLERLNKKGQATELLGINYSEASNRFAKAEINENSNPRLNQIYSFSAYYLIN
ncbi:hypothetical protein GW940_01390 [Candidatus Microgenomates bacterium]|nr:hypothetical protein [Candidatus Microgenomates bacterium]